MMLRTWRSSGWTCDALSPDRRRARNRRRICRMSGLDGVLDPQQRRPGATGRRANHCGADWIAGTHGGGSCGDECSLPRPRIHDRWLPDCLGISSELLVPKRFLLASIVLLAAACTHGQAHADLLLNIRSETPQTVTVRWTSTGLFGSKGLAFVGTSDSVNGLSAGTYTLSVDGGPSTMNLIVAPSTGNPTSTVVVGKDLSLTMQ